MNFTLSCSGSNVAEMVEPLDEVAAELRDEMIRELQTARGLTAPLGVG
jgi:hypothetical protein